MKFLKSFLLLIEVIIEEMDPLKAVKWSNVPTWCSLKQYYSILYEI